MRLYGLGVCLLWFQQAVLKHLETLGKGKRVVFSPLMVWKMWVKTSLMKTGQRRFILSASGKISATFAQFVFLYLLCVSSIGIDRA